MKKINNFIMAGLAILAAAACTKTEKVENINRGGQEIKLNVYVPDENSTNDLNTKTILSPNPLIRWGQDDAKKMALYCFQLNTDSSEGSYSWNAILQSSSMTAADDYSSASFLFSSDKVLDSSKQMRMIYPYASWSYITDVSLAIEEKQTQSSAGEKSKAYEAVPMMSDFFSPSLENKTVEANVPMHILSSIIAFYVYDSSGEYSKEKVKDISLYSNSVNISGSTKLGNKIADDAIPELTGSSTMATVTLSNPFALTAATSKETSSPIYLSIVPSSFTGKIILTTDKALYLFTFNSPKTFNRAEVKDFSLNLSNANVERVALSSLKTPAVQYTYLARTKRGDYNDAVLTIEKSNDSVVGFYALMKPAGRTTSLTKEEVMNGDVYHFGDADNSLFELQSDGTVLYKKTMDLSGYGLDTFSFGVLPFDKYGRLGALIGNFGYGNSDKDVKFSDDSEYDW